eukprot:2311052-Rhodomonas_salina.1
MRRAVASRTASLPFAAEGLAVPGPGLLVERIRDALVLFPLLAVGKFLTSSTELTRVGARLPYCAKRRLRFASSEAGLCSPGRSGLSLAPYWRLLRRPHRVVEGGTAARAAEVTRRRLVRRLVFEGPKAS